MKTNIIHYLNFLVLLFGIAYLFWFHDKEPKVAYIRSSVLLEEFRGMKEARALYQQKLTEWQGNADRLTREYENVIAEVAKEKGHARKEQLLRKVESAKTDLSRYMAEFEKRSKEEQETIVQGALNQINKFVEEYAKRENYQLVLGVTLSGNILYGSDHIDITNKVLAELNKNYKRLQ